MTYVPAQDIRLTAARALRASLDAIRAQMADATDPEAVVKHVREGMIVGLVSNIREHDGLREARQVFREAAERLDDWLADEAAKGTCATPRTRI